MQKIGSALVFIVLGLIIIVFPILGVIPFSVLTGLAVLFLGVGLLAAGITSMKESTVMGIVELTLGALAIILGLGFIFNPGLFGVVAAVFVFIAGLFLVISGIVALATKIGGNIWAGVIALILGIIYLIVAVFVANPLYLGILIGLWLLFTGLLMLVQKE